MEGLEDVRLNFQMTLNEVNLILAALSELPFKVSHNLIHKVRQEAESQVANTRPSETDTSVSMAST